MGKCAGLRFRRFEDSIRENEGKMKMSLGWPNEQ